MILVSPEKNNNSLVGGPRCFHRDCNALDPIPHEDVVHWALLCPRQAGVRRSAILEAWKWESYGPLRFWECSFWPRQEWGTDVHWIPAPALGDALREVMQQHEDAKAEAAGAEVREVKLPKLTPSVVVAVFRPPEEQAAKRLN